MYNRARYYDTETGEFISRDPLEYVDGMSLYRGYFVPGGVDPSGLRLIDEDRPRFPDLEDLLPPRPVPVDPAPNGAFDLLPQGPQNQGPRNPDDPIFDPPQNPWQENLPDIIPPDDFDPLPLPRPIEGDYPGPPYPNGACRV